MWHTIPHLWVKVTTYVVYYTTYVVYYTTNVNSPEIPILFTEEQNFENSITALLSAETWMYLSSMLNYFQILFQRNIFEM